MAGIYIHIPFCKSKCYYCDFYSCTALTKKEAVIRGICRELEQRADFLGEEPIRTVYIGGGTPSLCTPSELGGLLDCIRARYDTAALEEITVEANPDDLTAPYLRALHAEGVNRLSIGIQSFIDRDLTWMHRRHDGASARRAVEEARKAGFENLTIDLIYGTGRMSLKEWEENIEQALRLDVPHISAYHLTLEPGTVFGKRLQRGVLHEVDQQQSVAEYRLLHDRLTSAGYDHYEISNFARPGWYARHNSSYWDGTHYLGAGPSAHSYDGTSRQWNIADVDRYLERMPSNDHFETEHLAEHTRYNEFIMTALRTARGVDVTLLERLFGAQKLLYFINGTKKFMDVGEIIQNNSVYYIPFEHYLISDAIISDLFYVESSI